LLAKFYKSYRYGRYAFCAVPDVFEEKRVFLEFLAKHLRLQVGDGEWTSLRNTDQIRRFVGKVVKRITDKPLMPLLNPTPTPTCAPTCEAMDDRVISRVNTPWRRWRRTHSVWQTTLDGDTSTRMALDDWTGKAMA